MTAVPSQIERDAARRPDLFVWHGPVDPGWFEDWTKHNPWALRCPAELLAFWSRTGGGDLFETEVLLGLAEDALNGEDLLTVNRALHSQGLPSHIVVFHVGSQTSGVDTLSGEFVELRDADRAVVRRFSSLDDWYRGTIRREYAERYGLG